LAGKETDATATGAAPSHRYHHGDLPNALKAAAVELIGERGPAGFSLREVARRAGVSHAAPAHHFGDSRGLLTALAIDAFRALDVAMTRAETEATDPADRLARVGRAYVEVARTRPGECSVVFRPDLVDVDDSAYQEWGARAYGHLVAAIEAVRDAHNPTLDVGAAARLCWSAVQGLVVLYPGLYGPADPAATAPPPIDHLATEFTTLLLDGLRAR
jgi:AcrR family transcriptional regulator